MGSIPTGMEVGVYLGDQSPDAGGGYTFQSDLLAALAEAAGASRHRFTLLVSERIAAQTRAFLGSAPVVVRPMRAAGLAGRLQAMLQRDFDVVRQRWRRRSALQRCVDELGLDFVWFLGSECQLLEAPYLATVWDLQHRSLPWFPEVAYGGEFEAREASNRWFLQRAAMVVTGTRAGAAEIERFFQVDPRQIRILPHPTPAYALKAGETAPDARSQAGIRASIGKRFVLYPAQFWAHKNHVALIRAAALLQSRAPDGIDVVFVGGDKGNLDYCKEVARAAGVSERCHFLGFVAREELLALYRSALALAYVSFGGPENLPPLEAFAIGCPVIAADVPGAREQLGDCVEFVDPVRPDTIAEAILKLAESEGRRAELIALGRARARAWRGIDFVRRVFGLLDDFEPVRRAWGRP